MKPLRKETYITAKIEDADEFQITRSGQHVFVYSRNTKYDEWKIRMTLDGDFKVTFPKRKYIEEEPGKEHYE
jgi:hypothetical protein